VRALLIGEQGDPDAAPAPFSKTVCHQFLEVLPTTSPELADAIA
jgi:hypothetical protein